MTEPAPSMPVDAEPFADEIARLLHPVSVDELLQGFWARKPLHISGVAGRFAGLFDKSRFDAAIACAQVREDFAVSRFTQDFDGVWTCSEAIDAGDIDRVIAGNQTVCVRNIAAGDDALAAFGERFMKRLGLVGKVGFNAYLSGDGSGADWHFDRSITCALQLEGRKRWRFGLRPAVPWPPGNGRMQADGTSIYAAPWFGTNGWDEIPRGPFEEREVVLEPGDWLILPAGTWHDAKAIGGSLALNMLFSPFPFDAVLQQSLREIFGGAEAWRGGIPGEAAVADDGLQGVAGDYVDARLVELRAALASGRLRAALATFYRECIG